MTWQTEHWEWDGDDKYQPEKANVDLIPNTSGNLGDASTHWNNAFIDVLNAGSIDCTEITSGAITSGQITAIGDVRTTDLIATGDVGGSTLTISGAAEITGPIGGASLDITGTGIIGDDLTVSGKVSVTGNVEIEGNGNALKLYYGSYFVGLKAPSSLIASSTYTLPSAAGTTGQVLSLTGTPGELAWANPATGDVTGPAASTNNAIARFDSISGKAIKNSVVMITDAGDMSGAQNITASGNVTVGVAGSLIVSGNVGSNLISSSTNFNLGAADHRWGYAYINNLNVGQYVETHLIPSLANLNIGSATYKWSTVYAVIMNASSNVSAVGNISATGDLSAGGTLDVTGRTDLRGVVEVHNNITFDAQVTTFGLVTVMDGLSMGSPVTGYLYPAVSGGGGVGTSSARWGDTYISGLDADGGAVFNDSGASNANVRIEGDTNEFLFYTKASADKVGIGTSNPSVMLDVAGGASFRASVNSEGFRIATTNFSNVFHVSGSVDTVYLGAGMALPTSSGRTYATQDDDEAEMAVLHLNQANADQPYLVFTGGTVFTSKTAEDEYIMVLKGTSVRCIRLYS